MPPSRAVRRGLGTHTLHKVCPHKQVAVTAKGKTTIATLAACNDDASRAAVATFDDTNATACYRRTTR